MVARTVGVPCLESIRNKPEIDMRYTATSNTILAKYIFGYYGTLISPHLVLSGRLALKSQILHYCRHSRTLRDQQLLYLNAEFNVMPFTGSTSLKARAHLIKYGSVPEGIRNIPRCYYSLFPELFFLLDLIGHCIEWFFSKFGWTRLRMVVKYFSGFYLWLLQEIRVKIVAKGSVNLLIRFADLTLCMPTGSLIVAFEEARSNINSQLSFHFV